jgi:HPt (histidine-containing phosphotransfer) domain-containing protein
VNCLELNKVVLAKPEAKMTTLQIQRAPSAILDRSLWAPSSGAPLGVAFAFNAIKAINAFTASERNICIEVSKCTPYISHIIADNNTFFLLNLVVRHLTIHCANSILAISMSDSDGRDPYFTIKLTQNLPSTPAVSDINRVQSALDMADVRETLDWDREESFGHLQRLALSKHAKLTCERVSRDERHMRLELVAHNVDTNCEHSPAIKLPSEQEGKQAKHILIATRCLDDIWQSVEAQASTSCIVSRVNSVCEANEVVRYFKIDVLLVDTRAMGNSDASAMIEFENYSRVNHSTCQIFLYGIPRVIAARRFATLNRLVTGLGLEYVAERSRQPDCCFEMLNDLVAVSEAGVADDCDTLEFDFDADRLGELIGVLQPSKFTEASRQFLADISQLVNVEPERALQTNPSEYLGLFHKLGSSAGFFGALELCNICYDLQESLIQIDQSTRRSKLSSFKALAKSTEHQLGKFNDLLQEIY